MSQLQTIQDEDSPIWLPRLAVHGGPRFLQMADALQAAAVDGSLKPGDRLPSQRQLATQLNGDLTTITRAYDEARRRNLLEGRGALRRRARPFCKGDLQNLIVHHQWWSDHHDGSFHRPAYVRHDG